MFCNRENFIMPLPIIDILRRQKRNQQGYRESSNIIWEKDIDIYKTLF